MSFSFLFCFLFHHFVLYGYRPNIQDNNFYTTVTVSVWNLEIRKKNRVDLGNAFVVCLMSLANETFTKASCMLGTVGC